MTLLWLIPILVASLAASCASSGGSEMRGVEKPPIISAAQWGSKPQPIPDSRRHTPRFITVHHAGVLWTRDRDPADFVRAMQSWGQRDKNWPDLPYHFLIAPDGRIFEGRSLDHEPESNTRYDLQGHIGVELMGSFDQQRMSAAQLQSLVKLLAHLSRTLSIEPEMIAGHRDRAPLQTTCPGDDLYRYIIDGQLNRWVKQSRAGQDPKIDLRPPLPIGPTTMITSH